MGYNFNDETPIYLQIIENIKIRIISKEYLPQQKLPSVRDLSLEYEVNPNTIQKALSELENSGLIFTERTNGKYVTDNEKLISDVRSQTIRKMVDDFYVAMAKIGLEKEDVLEILNGKGIERWKF